MREEGSLVKESTALLHLNYEVIQMSAFWSLSYLSYKIRKFRICQTQM